MSYSSTKSSLSFLAIDFETANPSRDSACSVGLVLVQNKKITEKAEHLIKPPTREFSYWNMRVHGITWNDVKEEKTFKQLWKDIKPFFDEADFLVAHNASFDKSVLMNTSLRYNMKLPWYTFYCTMKLSREMWDIRPTKLPIVCNAFNIPLVHHNALSDATACAKIMLKVIKSRKYELT